MLSTMNLPKYEYRTEFAKRYYGEGYGRGKAEGKAEGRAEVVLRQLARRFGDLPENIRVRIRGASIEDLDRIGDQLLTATSLSEALELAAPMP